MENNALNFEIKTELYDVHLNKQTFMKAKDKAERWVMFIVEKGDFYFKINGQSGVAKAGDIVICPPQIMFHREVISTLFMHYCAFSWVPLSPNVTHNDITKYTPKYILRFKETKELSNIFTALRYIHAKPSNNRKIWISHLLNNIWFKYCMKDETVQNPNSVGVNDPLIRKVKFDLEKSAFKNLKIQDIAESFYMQPGQLSKRFKATYGMTPVEYVQNLRLDKIKSLLIQTDYTIQEIAIQCGYSNGFYLSRVFKGLTGVSPSEYRSTYII